VKLHSPQFEKALRRGVKREIRRSPVLKKEYRKAKKAVRRHYKATAFFRVIWSILVGVFVWIIVTGTGHPASGLAVINLVTFLSLSIFAQHLLATLFRANDLRALALLPIRETAIFHWELQKFFLKYAVFSIFDMAAGYIALATCLQLSFGQVLIAGVCAALSWVMLLALAALCAARLPRLPYARITGIFILIGFCLFVGHKFIGSAVLGLFDAAAPALNLILPTGWAPSLLQVFLPGGNPLDAVLIIPMALVIFSIRNSLELLRSRLKFREHVAPEVHDLIPGAQPDAKPSRAGITAIEDAIQSRQFLEQPQPAGWLEKNLWQWLTPREKSLMEFAFPGGLVITKPWIKILRNFVLMVLIGFAASFWDYNLQFWIYGLGLFITLLQCLAQIWSNGAAFRVMLNSGIIIPMYAVYPVTFRDLSGTLFKLSIIQLPLFLVYAMASVVLVGHFAGLNFLAGIALGFKIGLLIFATRFIITVLAFSARTNDTAKFRIRTIALIFIFLVLGILFLALSSGGVFVLNPGLSWFLSLAAVFDAYALFKIYGWFFNANRFDLMSVPRR
jgi:hypothetical protein